MNTNEVVNIVDIGKLEAMADISVVMIVLFFIMIALFLFGRKKR